MIHYNVYSKEKNSIFLFVREMPENGKNTVYVLR